MAERKNGSSCVAQNATAIESLTAPRLPPHRCRSQSRAVCSSIVIQMRYKIIYHVGEEINIKTKVEGGALTWQEQSLLISGSPSFEVPFSSFVSIDMFRMHGLGRMIKLVCSDRTIFLTVVRFNIAGYFAVINFFKAGELYERLKCNNKSAPTSQPQHNH